LCAFSTGDKYQTALTFPWATFCAAIMSLNLPGINNLFSTMLPSLVTALLFGSSINALSRIKRYSYISEARGPIFISNKDESFFTIGVGLNPGEKVPITCTLEAPGAFILNITELS